MMLEKLGNIREDMTGIFKRMLVIALYLGVLLSLFAIHRYLLLNDGGLASHIGFSFLNALALAKVILVGQELRIGDKFRNSALIYVILAKSAIFAVLLLVFRIIEEAVIGAMQGKNMHDAIFSGHPGFEHNKFQVMALTCIIMFFALMPFFAYLEFERVLGDQRLRALMFGGAKDDYAHEDEASARSGGAESPAYAVTGSVGAAPEQGASAGSASVTADRGQDTNRAHQDLWFYEQAGEVMGPVSERELARLLRLGVVSQNTLVHNVSVGEGWRMLQETEIL
jgi:hypothetical protein